MNPEPSELYESILGRVSDGLDVDWHSLEKNCPQLAPRWHGLRRVQEISRAFLHVRETPEMEASAPRASTTAVGGPAPLQWGALRLAEKIGEGSFAEVYRARDPILDREVALKLTRREGTQQKRFLNEGRRLAQIDHPGVVQVYGAAIHDDRAGMWMDLASGRSLDQRLHQDGRFSEVEVIDIARQLSSALGAVHGVGLVHGDIKAANVLRRDGGAIVLGDFGSSIDLRAGHAEPSSATPLYAAPEVLRGEPVDARSDVYSLGVLLFQLLTTSFPFEGESLAGIRLAHRERKTTRLRDLRPDLSVALADLIERALAVDPAERWQSAGEFGDACEELVRGSLRQDSLRFGPRPRIAVAFLGAGLLGAALLTAMLIREPTKIASPRADPPRVALLRTGDETALQTGDPVQVGDALHLRIHGNDAPLWLYLVNEDARGRVYKLFPLAGVEPSNPLPSGDLRLPGRIAGVEQDWVVTSEGRTESFLFVTSREPLLELEEALVALDVASADRASEGPTTFEFLTRGVGGLAAAAGETSPGVLLGLRQMVLESSSGGADDQGEVGRPTVEIVTLRGVQAPRVE